MIKALILIHLWSLVIAAIAWALQCDGSKEVGANFPKPKVWLSLILLCLLPGIIFLLPLSETLNTPKIEIFEFFVMSETEPPTEKLFSLNYPTIYICLALILMGRTLWRWAQLQRLPLQPTSEPDVFETRADKPPLTLSWPRRAIVVPHTLKVDPRLIRHERTHLRHYDAEVTLMLLCLRDLMLRNPAISYLVRQWRLSIELRADHAATKMLTTTQRKDYAALLLNGLRPCGQHTDGGALPCPTAHLTSTRHRSVKMRLTQIMQNKPNPRKRRWRTALLLTTLGSGVLGFSSISATATDQNVTVQTGENTVRHVTFQTGENIDEIIYVNRTPPRMPTNCPDLDPNAIDIQGKEITTLDGKSIYQHTATVGFVIMKYDAKPDGSTHNLRVVKSNHPCFEPEAKASVAQWMIEPQGKDIKDVLVVLRFMMTGETHEDLEGPLNKLLQ